MQRIVAPELMDDPGTDPRELAQNFDDIERANRWFGGTRPILREVFARGAARVLDVACGSGDIARALDERAPSGGSLEIVALDYSETILAIARARTGRESSIRFVQADAEALPFAVGSFDIATCSLALHHFEPPQAIRVLRELRRVARLTPLVCDLERSWSGYVATLAFARIIARNRLTRHDAPLSVRRAYTREEARALAREAGWRAPVARKSAYFRMLLTDGP